MMESEHQCSHCKNKLCIHKVPIFNNLGHEDLLKISELIQHKTYKKGERLFSLGDKLDFLVIINEGSAKAYTFTAEGREQILYLFSEGDFLGEQYLLGKRTATYTVEALETVKVCMLSKEYFQKLLLQYPDIGIKIIDELGKRMYRLEHAMESMGIRNIDIRIHSLLLDYVDKYGKEVPEGILIRLPISREGMANYLGITRETISRKLSQLENQGVIRSVTNKSILIINRAALEEV
jgi:CRP/FNR family transcriptional regulator